MSNLQQIKAHYGTKKSGETFKVAVASSTIDEIIMLSDYKNDGSILDTMGIKDDFNIKQIRERLQELAELTDDELLSVLGEINIDGIIKEGYGCETKEEAIEMVREDIKNLLKWVKKGKKK